MRQIILADNQNISSLGIRFLLNQAAVKELITEIETKKELFDLLQIDSDVLVILDYNLFDFDSSNELVLLNSKFDKTDWILFSDELNDDFLVNLLYNTNSIGVVLKSNSTEEIHTAICEGLKGRRYICNHVSNILLDITKRNNDMKRQENKLTATEQEILREIALGKTTKEIAVQRFVSSHTIMTHRKNIFRKLNVNNIHEATKYAIRAGIVDMAEYYI
jgi:DNA-binding NarL/FixJ family response regulator